MRTHLCDLFGIDVPIFAFSHCRDVVAAVTNAGGLGVLGALAFSPQQLELELKWIDDNVDGKPYGVDTVMPMSYAGKESPGSDAVCGGASRPKCTHPPHGRQGRTAPPSLLEGEAGVVRSIASTRWRAGVTSCRREGRALVRGSGRPVRTRASPRR